MKALRRTSVACWYLFCAATLGGGARIAGPSIDSFHILDLHLKVRFSSSVNSLEEC